MHRSHLVFTQSRGASTVVALVPAALQRGLPDRAERRANSYGCHRGDTEDLANRSIEVYL